MHSMLQHTSSTELHKNPHKKEHKASKEKKSKKEKKHRCNDSNHSDDEELRELKAAGGSKKKKNKDRRGGTTRRGDEKETDAEKEDHSPKLQKLPLGRNGDVRKIDFSKVRMGDIVKRIGRRVVRCFWPKLSLIKTKVKMDIRTGGLDLLVEKLPRAYKSHCSTQGLKRGALAISGTLREVRVTEFIRVEVVEVILFAKYQPEFLL
eukprot:g11753.t1